MRVLIRTLAGMEDFARVNAHYERRRRHPGLADARFHRSCLSCLVSKGNIVLDSEWHAFLECPLTRPARSRFELATGFDASTLSEACTVDSLVPLVTFTCADARRAGEFARLALDIRACRRHLFRRLSSDGQVGRVVARLRLRVIRPALGEGPRFGPLLLG